ncbi:MAG: glycosyltransferase family 4 protein [Planctomycetes bacterium]|nr:glycosyltransferase family 4 protein [Planctomycetota bacterium]
MTQPRLFLADPSLIGHAGHCFDYLAALAPAARARGFDPIYLGNRTVTPELRAGHGVFPVFTHWCDARYGTTERTRRLHESDLARELIDVCRRFAVTADDVFLINTLRHWALRGVIDWLESCTEDRWPRAALVLHFTAFPNPATSDGTVEFYRQAFARLARSPARERVRLLADSDVLVDEFAALAPALRFDLAPIPHLREVEDAPARAFRVGTVGEARENKGFHLLPRLVRRAAEADLRGVEFHIHSFASDPTAVFLRRALAGLRHPTVRLYPDEMTAAEYQRFLASLDLVVLPYTLDNYHAQTSGVFAEAMGAGKLVVAPRGSWMARQLDEHGGGAAFAPGDAEDFARVTLDVIADRARLQEGRAARAARWREFHNPERFLELVCA